MPSLYVAYTANTTRAGTSIFGWTVISQLQPPQSVGEIKAICDKIAAQEELKHVVPLWWKEIYGPNS